MAAIFAYHSAAPAVDRDELRCIRDHMVRRGPDGKGEWYSDDGRLALGHRRLAVIDLSERGAQPMVSSDGKLVVSFNGEIYNHKELRRSLEADGHQFRSQSDTEVLLHLYAEKGEAMVHDLRGMFTFALWDASKGAMLLARDGYGIKPFYYADDGRTIRVASQVKALLAGGKVSRSPEPAGVCGFFLFGSVPEPFTTYEQIRAIPAGNLVWIDSRGPSKPKVWFSLAATLRDAAERVESASADKLRWVVRDALHESVRSHLEADVSVGLFLSGGVDSGALLGMMNDVGAENVPAVTIAFEEFRGQVEDETCLAECLANKFNARHCVRVVTEGEFIEDLDGIFDAMDQPSIDGVNTWFVSKTARELGLKVAISGIGGDELFGGYTSFRDVPQLVTATALPSRIPFLGKLSRSLLLGLLGHRVPRSPKLAGVIEYGGSYDGAYLLRRGLFMPWELSALVAPEALVEGLQRLRPLHHIGEHLQPDPRVPFARVAVLEASLYMRNQLLRDTDWSSMAHSLEVRTPLVDTALARRLSPYIVSNKRLVTKSLLAQSPNSPLEPAIVNRPKSGFCIPGERWVVSEPNRGIWKRMPLLHRPSSHWARRWGYVVSHRSLDRTLLRPSD